MERNPQYRIALLLARCLSTTAFAEYPRGRKVITREPPRESQGGVLSNPKVPVGTILEAITVPATLPSRILKGRRSTEVVAYIVFTSCSQFM